MDMIARILLVALILMPVVSAQAAKKAPADDEVEYLIPEDWESKKDEPKAPPSLELTPKAFQVGMAKHIKEIPQCKAAKLGAGSPIKDGQVVYQELKLDGAEVDIILDVNPAGKISNAKFTGPNGAKDNSQLQLMMCSTYAIMRTLQPEYEKPEQAQRNMSHVWKSAATKPFKMAFYFNSIKTQYVPFEMNVF
ncbi:hypothetical protein ACM1ZW_19640 [Pseudomonas sp. NFX71]|uniref:hypothetical protein n=1 Tax=Pseudomonas sp. NFX71 TaxID=3399121 RepID=UPI003A899A69